MRLGHIARSLLGPRLFAPVAAIYRGLFMDLAQLASAIGPLPAGTQVLDVGGGDGKLLNYLLERSPDTFITLVDASSSVGDQLEARFRDRVVLLGATRLADYARTASSAPDVVLLSDVMHHVAPAERGAFLQDLRSLLAGRGCRLFLKEMEPGHLRTFLGGLADRYISGDPNVEFLSQAAARELVLAVFPAASCAETSLFSRDRPNYCLCFTIPPVTSGNGA